ncbi:MAG: hypothetical protein JST39_17595 [Bacteroidetes bacterium]|nr:hypothetical protein [Bacteroidota bacterium]
MQRFLLAPLLCFYCWASAQAQYKAPVFRPDQSRIFFHEKVDREQERLKGLDGKKDDSISLSHDDAINGSIYYALITRVDQLQEKYDSDSTWINKVKVKYIKGLESLLIGYNNNARHKDFPVTMAPELVDAYVEAVQLDQKGESIEPVIRAHSYGVGKVLVDCFIFPSENKGVKPSRALLVEKYLGIHPKEILTVLQRNPDLPSTDSLVGVAARNDPHRFYDYASVNDRLGARIRSSKDTFVHTIARMATSANRSGQLYFPFLDLLVHGRITFEEIDKVKDDNLAYFRLLVKTRIDFAARMMAPQRDTPMEMKSLTAMMTNKAKQAFVREINGLHDQPDAVRFRILEPLTSQELYYLCVVSEDEIYTSSYLGVYKRIFERMKNPRGDSLLMSVNADYFRKFIKMAAAYNTLDTLLKSMPGENATTLMKAFISRIEATTSVDNVEDAVDVADSYSSIVEKNKRLADFMRQEAALNYRRCADVNDKNGMVVYRLEKALFESADTSSKVDLSRELGIPPIYTVDYKSLVDDSGRVIQQVFFYGDEDKDGQNSYNNFKALFTNRADWAMSENNDWLSIRSLRGKPVLIYANKPLYGENDPDEEACKKLTAYLESKHLQPTIFIHRGHSYHVNSTLSKLQPSARIVILGSCGGYNNLNEVLTISKDAHIISSKQVGTKTVNEPILKAINATLTAGRNVEWLPMWKDLRRQFANDANALDKFEDYIPPYKNLGAIFIKAYRKAME